MLVRTGERIPVDGTVVDGEAAVDEAVITGESLPVTKDAGDVVVGGSMVADGAVTVRVGEDATSSLDRITELVWDLQSGTHGIQKLADKLATIFVPVVLVLAVVVTALNLVLGTSIDDALLIGLTVLIVSCPCALGLRPRSPSPPASATPSSSRLSSSTTPSSSAFGTRTRSSSIRPGR